MRTPKSSETPHSSSMNHLITQYTSHFKSCKTISHLQQLHAHIIRTGLEQEHFLVTHFLAVCNSFSNISYATAIFNRVSNPTSVYVWNSFIKGNCENSSFVETILVFIRMKRGEVLPDKYTYPSLIKACANAGTIKEGVMIHGSAIRCGVDDDLFVGTSLIDFYGKCKEIGFAKKVFDEMSVRSVVSFTAMVVGFANVGDLVEAKRLFDEMPSRNLVSWNAMISGFTRIGDLSSARKMFDDMPEKNVVSYTSLIDAYAKSGDMASARLLFEKSSDRDIVAWSALISGYVQNSQPDEAVKIFVEMDRRNVQPDEFILVSLMSACSRMGNLEQAKWVDAYVSRNSIDLCQAHVVAALIDMNGKCGNIGKATKLFDELPKRDLVSYCSMIQGLSMHGFGDQAVGLFSRMLNEGLTPDNVAFTVILTACSHAGLVEEGCRLFNRMQKDFLLAPSPDQYACMVDLLGRSGRLKAAYELIKSMPMEPHAGVWGALLGACKLHCDTELGEMVGRRLFEIEPLNGGNYILLSNIYAADDRWPDVSLVRYKMKERGVIPIGGRSWI